MNRPSSPQNPKSFLTLQELCEELSISTATGRNWLRLGKLVPDPLQEIHKAKPLFSAAYAAAVKKRLQSDPYTPLKSRRNKTYISGNHFYDSYLNEDSANTEKIKTLLTLLPEAEIVPAETIRILLAECALRLCIQASSQAGSETILKTPSSADSLAGNEAAELPCPTDGTSPVAADCIRLAAADCFLQLYMRDCTFLPERYWPLIEELLPPRPCITEFIEKHAALLSIAYTFVPGEDLLGLLYLSLKQMGERKSRGSYYTPFGIVRQLLDGLPAPKPGDTLLDPCCGTGNFLLQLLASWNLTQIYGYDTDALSIAVTRLNLALHDQEADIGLLQSHIVQRDFLSDEHKFEFDYIIGNPPWGLAFSPEERRRLGRDFACAGKSPESYDLFLEQGLTYLKDGGRLSFVLPEAVLTVNSHRRIRRLILDCAAIDSVAFLGNVFGGVQCPAVILQLVKANQKAGQTPIRVTAGRSFVIREPRPLGEEGFYLQSPDEEYRLLQKIAQAAPSRTLRGHAEFALGIVTGNNRQFVRPRWEPELEPVFRGTDLEPYRIGQPGAFLAFAPERFQQTAKEAMYRVPEKLLYRFISRRLVFAYDDRQRLSLNSCNILIPHLAGLHIQYILAVLNSRPAQFFFQQKWNSLKVLRCHLEQIPIPVISKERQAFFIERAKALAAETEPAQWKRIYEELDRAVADLFSLTDVEYAQVTAAVL